MKNHITVCNDGEISLHLNYKRLNITYKSCPSIRTDVDGYTMLSLFSNKNIYFLFFERDRYKNKAVIRYRLLDYAGEVKI